MGELAAADGLGDEERRLPALAGDLIEHGVVEERPAVAFAVPGRIEILGKHTDYAGGRSMTAATQQGFHLVAAPRADRQVRLLDCGEAGGGPLVGELAIGGSMSPPAEPWLVYPATVVERLAADFPGALSGVDLAFSSDLPQAAGMASSSAFVTGVFLALSRLAELERHEAFRAEIPDDAALAGYLGAVENGRPFGGLAGGRGVGTLGGSEDHTAILCSQPDRLGRYSYLPVTREDSLPMPEGYLFAVASSGVVAEKSGGARAAYNRAARLAAEAAEAWSRGSGREAPHLAAALEAAGSAEDLVAAILEGAPPAERDALARRARHFAREHGELVPAACTALERRDLARFGELVDRSQALAEELLDNQIPETRRLARDARRLGAAAASAFGAGFGGSVWALVESERAEDFLSEWSRVYLDAFPEHSDAARFLVSTAAGGARELLQRRRDGA